MMKTAGDLKAELDHQAVSWTVHEKPDGKYVVEVQSKKHTTTTERHNTEDEALNEAVEILSAHISVCPLCR